MSTASDAARAPTGAQRSACIGGRYSTSADGLHRVDAHARAFEAFDDVLQRPVEMHMRRIDGARRRARFRRAALAASHMVHPNIVRVLDFGVHDDASFLVVERGAGHTLRHELDRAGPMPWPRAVHVLRQMSAAVATMHDGTLESDVAYCVPDLGMSRVRLCDVEGMRDFVKVHVAPLLRPDAHRDVRALGRIAWQLLVGDELPRGRLRVPRVRAYVDVPPALDDVVAAALDLRAAHRPSAVEMFAALRALMPGR
jgi:hypothetical protein